MAFRSLLTLGISLLLTVVVEIQRAEAGYPDVVDIPNGDYLSPCMKPKLDFTVEFQQIQFNNSRIYRRVMVKRSVLLCLSSYSYPNTSYGAQNTMEDCVKNAARQDHRTFFILDEVCTSLISSFPNEFRTCPVNPNDDLVPIYTTIDRSAPYTLPQDQEMQDCSVKVSDDLSGFTVGVEDTGSCANQDYRVTYNCAPGNSRVRNNVFYPLAMCPCTMVNFTVYREVGGVSLGSDTCLASTITGPGPIYFEPTPENINLVFPNSCVYMEYTVYLLKPTGQVQIAQGPVVGKTLQIPRKDIGSNRMKVVFSSDVRMKIPKPMFYP